MTALSLARRLCRKTGDIPPTVVQMRLGGAKGLLCLMSPQQHEQYVGKEVILRDSMIKAVSTERYTSDPSVLTVDVVSFGYLQIGASLSQEAIVIMVHNGIPPSVFLELSKRGLDELEMAFSPAAVVSETEDDVLSRIATACFRQGGVGKDRRSADCIARGSSAKVAGLAMDRPKSGIDVDKIDEDNIGLIDTSEQYSVDPVSGQPGSIAERCVSCATSLVHIRAKIQLDASCDGWLPSNAICVHWRQAQSSRLNALR